MSSQEGEDRVPSDTRENDIGEGRGNDLQACKGTPVS